MGDQQQDHLKALARAQRSLVVLVSLLTVLVALPWIGVGYCFFVGGSMCPAALTSERSLAERPSGERVSERTAPPSRTDAIVAAPGTVRTVAGATANPKWVAIVIGNSAYEPPNTLANPKNDATDVAATLQKLGYTLVADEAGNAQWLDLGRDRLDRALRAFAKRAADAEVALVYYAGHGMEEDGVNYLIPTDARLDRDVDLANEAYDFGILTKLLPRYGVSIVIIDACRTPRFRLADRAGKTRAVEGQRGFQVVEAPDRALLAFSAGPNQRASDGLPGERNSPYTRELLASMQEADVKIEDVFKNVRQKFIDRSAEQKPEFRDNLGRPNLAFQAAEPPREPGTEFRDCDKCPLMVVLPRGKFLMGAPTSEEMSADEERPQHEVTIAKEFAIGKFEVTFDDWDACLAEQECAPEVDLAGRIESDRDEGWGRGRRPKINVSWFEAKQYIAWLNRKVTAGRGKYRLLTESEWEYAARAGTSTAYPWGAKASHEFANYGSDQCCYGFASGRDKWGDQTAPVGSFPPNRFGLFDMNGNVFEWIEDCWKDNYDGAPADGSAVLTGDCGRRAIRGGSWLERPQNSRSANRHRTSPSTKSSSFGFRVARSL